MASAARDLGIHLLTPEVMSTHLQQKITSTLPRKKMYFTRKVARSFLNMVEHGRYAQGIPRRNRRDPRCAPRV